MGENTKQLTGPDLALIRKFADVWDRQRPLVFVGRKTELEIVGRNCRQALENSHDGEFPAGHIVVFSGAPGSGKSSLLAQLRKFGVPEIDPLFISVPLNLLENLGYLVQEIGKRVLPSKAKEMNRKITTAERISFGFKNILGLDKSETRETGPLPARFGVLAELHPPQKWQRPVCLLVDEIQAVTKEHGNALRELHLGEHGLPIVTVAAGLSNSAEKLRQAMSPRLTAGNLRILGALSPKEVRSCVQQMLERCRVDYSGDQLDWFGGEIAERSEGWPQHMRTETAALFGELDETRGDLDSVNIAAFKVQADFFRENSYQARKSQAIDDSILLTGALLNEIPRSGCTKLQAIRKIRQSVKPKEGWELPDGIKPSNFLNHLIHQGILQPDENDVLSCPIPSLRNWIVKRAARECRENLAEPSRSAPENRNALKTVLRPQHDETAEDRKRRSVPDRDRGTER